MLLFWLLPSLCASFYVNAQLSTDELINENAEEIANRTYAEQQTELQRTILQNYDKKQRPVRNGSQPVLVYVHVYIMHLTVDQKEQTITLNGHLYMTWDDEYAVWEHRNFNGIRHTMLRYWEVWTPDLRITNSVAGIGQSFEISKRAHILLQNIVPGKLTKVEVYPTFTIRMGCKFDYSAYPFDKQKCSMGLYSSSRMSEVQLLVIMGTRPTVMLGWGAQSDKTHISDFKLEEVTADVSYFSLGNFSNDFPVDPKQLDRSWSVVYTWLTLRRNAFCFGITVLLPSLISYMFIIFSFFLPSPDSAIYILISNLFLSALFLEDLTSVLPPAVGSPPRIVYFTAFNICLTTIAICAQFWLRYIIKKEGDATGLPLKIVIVRRILPLRWRGSDVNEDPSKEFENVSWTTVANCFRLSAAMLLFIIFLVSLLILLI